MSPLPYVLIVWAVAGDGLPALPIKIVPQPTLTVCRLEMAVEIRKPNTKAVCRLARAT